MRDFARRLRNTGESAAGPLVLIAAAAIAVVSAQGVAGSWNDGSRLATVESLVDYHTLAIDRSIFVQVPPRPGPTELSPYPADDPLLVPHGTRDKLLIGGRFYSDKSPIPAVLMAALYQGLQWSTGLRARERPDWFVYWMTVGSSGLAYVVAVWSIFQLGQPLRLPAALRLTLTASFGLATVALTYVRHVNSHIVLLGVAAALVLGLARLAEESRAGSVRAVRLLGLGTLAGLGYTIDLGAGPLLLVCTLPVIVYRCKRFRALAILLLGTLPWLVLHHALNYAVGGTFRPANAIPEYVNWPGSAVTPQNMTGLWNHKSLGHFSIYALALLFGKRGFLGHNLSLFLTLPGLLALLRRRPPELPEILWAAGWCSGTWALYATTSTNYSGVAASIRWFVPLLAPAYYMLAAFLREHPGYRKDFLVLSGWGIVLAGLMWWKGPWMKRMVPFFWPIQAAALVSWAVCRIGQRRREARLGIPSVNQIGRTEGSV